MNISQRIIADKSADRIKDIINEEMKNLKQHGIKFTFHVVTSYGDLEQEDTNETLVILAEDDAALVDIKLPGAVIHGTSMENEDHEGARMEALEFIRALKYSMEDEAFNTNALYLDHRVVNKELKPVEDDK